MLIRAINHLRCELGHWLIENNFPKSYFLVRFIAPETGLLIKHRNRYPPPLKVPRTSHLIYHQQTVDALCMRNSIESLAPQIPTEDEVVFLDVGGTVSAEVLTPFLRHAWRTYAACEAPHPEQRSYTYGLNTMVSSLKSPKFIVWRTDYVYPPDIVSIYAKHLEKGLFASPYAVLIGNPALDSNFVRSNWDRVSPTFDAEFWRVHSQRLSLYETQDPALFGMHRELWDRIGGLNHQLWGYGWQFAEFAARIRQHCPDELALYFECVPPLHQTHEGTLMHENPIHADSAEAGIQRFSAFLGGRAAYQMYRIKWHLKPRPPKS